MVLSKDELLATLQKEVRILLHLASKIDRAQLDYRPTPKQRSTLELLRYLAVMGPGLIDAANNGFDRAKWAAATEIANARDFDQTVAALADHATQYDRLIGAMSDADFRTPMNAFDGSPTTRGAFIVYMVLGGLAAYRTQLFCYLKACGRSELTTANLWMGADPA